jgi:Protein of unknown function (DUF1549)/Protein of unknown function (DUF1553)
VNDEHPNDLNDRFLDAALREVFSNERPPDLRESILAALKGAPDVNRPPREMVSPKREELAPSKRSSLRSWAMISAAMVLLVLIPGLAIYFRGGQFFGNTAKDNIATAPHLFPKDTAGEKQNHAIVKSASPDPEPLKDVEMPNFGPGLGNKLEVAVGSSKVMPTYKPVAEADLLAQMKTSLHSSWTVASIKPSPDATDTEWCRRAFLALLGRVPSVSELDTFIKNKAENKREQLVTSLLGDSSYADESSKRLAALWTNVLIGRVGGEAPERVASRAGLVDYLTRAFRENRSFDKIVKELLTATGSSDPAASDYNGAVNFLLDGYSNKATLATARTSRIFLGKQLQCVQCHDHPSADTKQAQFWGMNAFFRQMGVERKDGAKPKLVNVDFRGEAQQGAKQNPSEAEIYYEQKNGELKVAFPTFLDGAAGPHSGLASEVDRRAALADWIVTQEDMPRAVVNRVWSQLLGFGFSQPVDDLGPHNPANNPELLETLSQQFIAYRYDLKALTRWIVLSDAFNRSSRLTADNIADVPEQGAKPLFSRYYTRQMDPESLFDSLHIASAMRHDASTLRTQRAQWLGQFMSDMKNDEADEHSTYNGGIPQSLTMMNGEAMIEAVSLAQGSTLKTVIASIFIWRRYRARRVRRNWRAGRS